MLGLLGMTIWLFRKLKHLTTSEDVAEARNATKLALVVGIVCLSVTIGVVYKAVQPFVDRIGWALTTEHEVAHFFLGKITHDPGWLFYPLMLSIFSAPLTLPLFLLGFVVLCRLRHQPQYAKTYRIYASLSIFILLFTFCMSIGAKKFNRYLLPVFPIMDILAANYLNQKPDAENLTVRVSPLSAEFFGYYFKGRSYRRDSDPGIFSPDYEVVYIRDIQINRVNLEDIEGTLEHVIRLNHIDYVWIYKLSSPNQL